MGIQYQAYNRRYRPKKISYFPIPVALSGLISIALITSGVGISRFGYLRWGLPPLSLGVVGVIVTLGYWVYLDHQQLLTSYLQGAWLKTSPDNSEGLR